MSATIRLLTVLLFSLPLPLMAQEVVINAVGDIMLAGRWTPRLRQLGYDHPFSAVSSELARGDITLANLETPVARGGREFTDKKFRFRAEPEVIGALKRNRINMVTLANNHIMDFGPDALAETIRHLDASAIPHMGAGLNLAEARKPVITTVNGKRVAFLGYSLTQPIEFFAAKERPGTAPGYEKLITADISAAKQQADYVIVSIHWGTEGASAVQEYQRKTAHQAIEAGADVIIGHHPHVLRGIERYRSGIIFYSLGNFTFASKSATADSSAIVRIRLDDRHREAEILPLDILHRRVGFQPQPLHGQRAAGVITHLNKLSEPLGTRIEARGDHYTVPF